MTQLKKYVGIYLEREMLSNVKNYQVMDLIERRCLMMKKGRLNALRRSIKKAIKKGKYDRVSKLVGIYRENGGKIKIK